MKARSVIKRAWFPLLLVTLFAGSLWIGIANRSLYLELRDEGKDPVSITPITTPREGAPGVKGDRGTQGDEGARGQDGLQGAQGEAGVIGPQGQPGTPGADGRSIQGEPGPQGTQGVQGEAGPIGLTGGSGRTPILGCVIRDLNNMAVNYIAWRYDDEADDAYRNLYRLPTWAQAEGCLDLRIAA